MTALRIFLFASCIASIVAVADDAPLPAPEAASPVDPAAPVDPTVPTEPQRVLVTSTGRVVHGLISETPGGYRIETPNGTITFTYNDIACTATTVRDAHQKLHELFVPPSASGLLVLARWCIENRLYDLARDDIEAALRLEPARAEARNLLVQLELTLNPQPEQQQTENRFNWDAMLAPPVAAPGGLTRDATHQFVRRIQPLMLNTCSNARCHGNAQASFHLEFVPSSGVGGQGITTDNIEAVFDFVDIDNPRKSRLFTALEDSDIPAHRQVMNGPRGRDQLEMIAAWIMQGSLERGGKPPEILAPEMQTASAPVAPGDDEVTLAAVTQTNGSISQMPHIPMSLDDAPPISIDPLPVDADAATGERPVSIPMPTAPPVLQLTPRDEALDQSAIDQQSQGRQ